MKILILGGTGVISRSIVDQLLQGNHEVSVYNRGTRSLLFQREVRQIIGDRSDRSRFEQEMRRESFDVVIDMICFNEADARSTVRAFQDNAGQIMITSSVAAYKRPYVTVPTVESAERLWDDPVFPYAFHKAEMERYLQGVMAAENLPVTIVRPSLTFGPGAANIGILRQNYGIVDRIIKGKPLVMFGDGSTSWSFTFVPDLARGFVALAGNPGAVGEAFHVTSDFRNVWEDLYREFGRIVGIEPRIVHIPSEVLYKAAPSLCNHLYYEKTYAGLFDNSKIKSVAPGYEATISLAEGVRMLYDWFEADAKTVDPAKDALEDRLVAAQQTFADSVANIF